MGNGDSGEQPGSSGCAGIMAILRAAEAREAGSIVEGVLVAGILAVPRVAGKRGAGSVVEG